MKHRPPPVARTREVNESEELLARLISINDPTLLIVVFVLELAQAVGHRVEEQVDKLAYGLTNDCTNDCLPQVRVPRHIVAFWLVGLSVGVDGHGVVNVGDADAGQDGNANWEDVAILLLLLSPTLFWSVGLLGHFFEISFRSKNNNVKMT